VSIRQPGALSSDPKGCRMSGRCFRRLRRGTVVVFEGTGAGEVAQQYEAAVARA
jgi:hypothetical protein